MGRPKGSRSSEPRKSGDSEKKTRGKRYSGAEKAKILEQALAEISQGGQITKIAEKLGVTFFTLKSWLGESGDTAKPAKKSRGRKAGKPKKSVKSELSITTAPKVPGKRGRKPKSVVTKLVDSPTSIKTLEKKLEDLAARYVNLAHLYGELITKFGSPKL